MASVSRRESSEEFERDNVNILMHTLGIPSLLRQLKEKKKRRGRNRKQEMDIGATPKRKLYPELISERKFHIYYRLTKSQFHEIHEIIKDGINMKSTVVRKAIGSRERLLICLRFLATGTTLKSLGNSHRMQFVAVQEVVMNICDAICKKMGPIYMPKPTAAIWQESEEIFRNSVNFPNCCGVLYGKRVNIVCPTDNGNDHDWNYNEENPMTLLAIINPKGRFLYVDVGPYSEYGDSGIFEKSVLGTLLENGELQLPALNPVTPNSESLPHVIVADEAFPLKPYLMRPYGASDVHDNDSNKIFNYRLGRALSTVDSTFSIVRARWRAYDGPIPVGPELIQKVIKATCCLNNFLGFDKLPPDCHRNASDIVESATFTKLKPVRECATEYSLTVRNKYNRYFCEEGALPWQLDQVRSKNKRSRYF